MTYSSIWEVMRLKGYSRREFLRFCSYAAAIAGIQKSGVPGVVEAFETKPRPPVVWMHFQECTCCSESFIRSSHPIVADVVLDVLSLDYTETLQARPASRRKKACTTPCKNIKANTSCWSKARSRRRTTASTA